MRALVIFESMFGNTEMIAAAIADGLSVRIPVDVVEVGVAPTSIEAGVTLLVIGGPTHAFGMSRPATRQDAAKQAEGSLVSREIGLREWLDRLEGRTAVAATAFDTRIKKSWVPGSAARAASKRLRKLGFTAIESPQSFYVAGTPGPVLEGEQRRAREWGEKLGAMIATGRDPRVR